MTYRDAVRQAKREILTSALQAHGGNRAQTARALGLQRSYLLALIREHQVDVPSAWRRRPA